jgi:hypothetical protein
MQLPKSTTVSPTSINANLVGVPHPAPRIDASGMDFRSWVSYPTSSETCATDYKGFTITFSFREQQPPPLSEVLKGLQQESPVKATFVYLSFTFSFIICESFMKMFTRETI